MTDEIEMLWPLISTLVDFIEILKKFISVALNSIPPSHLLWYCCGHIKTHCASDRRKKKREKRKHEIKGPIRTVVVLVMENRSFDHMLGWLTTKSSRPDIDGLTGSESNRLNASDPDSPEVFVSDDAVFVDSDPGHSFQAIREQIFGSANSAPMNGFAQQAYSMGLGMDRTVMSGFSPDAVPVSATLADGFTLFDRWFASVPASTQPKEGGTS